MQPTWRRLSRNRVIRQRQIPKEHSIPEEFHTPDVKTIAEVSAFTGLPETSQMKSLVMVGE